MKITKIHAHKEHGIPAGVSIEIAEQGADFYADGTFSAWQDGNGMFNRCEATGSLHCHVPVQAVREAIAAAEKALGITFSVGAIIPGNEEIEAQTEDEK
jgi:hypothetical protein